MPLVRGRAQMSGDVVLLRRVRVANHLKLFGIVVNNHAGMQRSLADGGMTADTSHAESPLWVTLIRTDPIITEQEYLWFLRVKFAEQAGAKAAHVCQPWSRPDTRFLAAVQIRR